MALIQFSFENPFVVRRETDMRANTTTTFRITVTIMSFPRTNGDFCVRCVDWE